MQKMHSMKEKAQTKRDIFSSIWEKNTLKLYFLFSGKRELRGSKSLLLKTCKLLSFTSAFSEASSISLESRQEEVPRKLYRFDHQISLAASLAASLVEKNLVTSIIFIMGMIVFAAHGVTFVLLKSGIFSIIIIFADSSTKSAIVSLLFMSAIFSLFIVLTISYITGALIGETLAISIASVISNNSSSESWDMKWFSRPLSYLLPKDDREEWLGDLVEARHELLKAGYPRWIASLITVAKSGLLVWSLIRIRYQDLVSPSVRKKQD
jgi:hypothetical protein